MMFGVIKNAEIPQDGRGGNGGKKAIYPFADMDVGDGFDAPNDMPTKKSGSSGRQAAISACARNYAKRHNPTAKFTVRRLNETTIRCVRVA